MSHRDVFDFDGYCFCSIVVTISKFNAKINLIFSFFILISEVSVCSAIHNIEDLLIFCAGGQWGAGLDSV